MTRSAVNLCTKAIAEYGKDNPSVVVLLVGVILHGLALFLVLPMAGAALAPYYGAGFADDYDQLANTLATGNGYRFSPQTAETLMREPGYPLLLAAIFSLFGYSLPAARFVNLLLTAGVAWIVIAMVQASARNDRLASAGAAGLIFLHPGILIAEARGGFEMLYALCLALFAWQFSRAMNGERRRDWLLAGAILGLAILVRSSLIAFPMVALAWWVLERKKERGWYGIIAKFLLLTVAMGVVIGPWIARNYTVAGQFVPTATISGIAAHVGEYVCRNRDSYRPLVQLDAGARDERAQIARAAGYRFEDAYFPQFYSTRDEIEFSRTLRQRVLDYYVANPGAFVTCAASNVVNFWFAGKNRLASALNVIIQVPYLVLAVFGAFWLARESNGRTQLITVLLIVGYSIIVHAVTFAQARYSVPIIPLLCVLGAQPLARLWNRAFARGTQKEGDLG